MTRLQDDFYDYVNGKWAETAVIPDDKPSTGGFMDLDQDIENLMLDITGKWQRGEEYECTSCAVRSVGSTRLAIINGPGTGQGCSW